MACPTNTKAVMEKEKGMAHRMTSRSHAPESTCSHQLKDYTNSDPFHQKALLHDVKDQLVKMGVGKEPSPRPHVSQEAASTFFEIPSPLNTPATSELKLHAFPKLNPL